MLGSSRAHSPAHAALLLRVPDFVMSRGAFCGPLGGPELALSRPVAVFGEVACRPEGAREAGRSLPACLCSEPTGEQRTVLVCVNVKLDFKVLFFKCSLAFNYISVKMRKNHLGLSQ